MNCNLEIQDDRNRILAAISHHTQTGGERRRSAKGGFHVGRSHICLWSPTLSSRNIFMLATLRDFLTGLPTSAWTSYLRTPKQRCRAPPPPFWSGIGKLGPRSIFVSFITASATYLAAPSSPPRPSRPSLHLSRGKPGIPRYEAAFFQIPISPPTKLRFISHPRISPFCKAPSLFPPSLSSDQILNLHLVRPSGRPSLCKPVCPLIMPLPDIRDSV